MDMRHRFACKNSAHPFLMVEANGFHPKKSANFIQFLWNATTTENGIAWSKLTQEVGIFLSFLWNVEIQIGACKAGSMLEPKVFSHFGTNRHRNRCRCQNEAELLASCILRVIHWRNPIDLGDASDAQPAHQTKDMEFTCNSLPKAPTGSQATR